MIITRRVDFSASHLTRLAHLSDEENRALYGESAHAGGHGHNYTLQVSLEGEPDAVTGMIVDLKLLKEILHREVVDDLDHRFLNYQVKPFDEIVPTVENITVEIWNRLEPVLKERNLRLQNVRLYETEDLWVDYRGEVA